MVISRGEEDLPFFTGGKKKEGVYSPSEESKEEGFFGQGMSFRMKKKGF